MHGVDKFPRSAFKGLAGTQVAVGIFLVVLGVADIAITLQTLNRCGEPRPMDQGGLQAYEPDYVMHPEEKPDEFDWNDENNFGRPVEDQRSGSAMWYVAAECDNPMLMLPSYYCAGIWCGILLVITGSLGIGAGRSTVAHRQSGLKTGYIVMNIIMIIFFLPMLFGIGGAEAVTASPLFARYGMMSNPMKARMAIGILIAIMAFIQFIFAIVCAALSCCCAPITDIQMVPASPHYYTYGVQPAVNNNDKVALVDNEVIPEETKEDPAKC
jgi:hypothetical protein